MEPKRTATAIETAPGDAFQREVKDIVGGEKEWSLASAGDAEAIDAQRRRQVHALFDGAEVVDLVGHSTPIHRYLKLGDWVLEPAETERLASYLPASVKSVRLIGCATASTAQGCAAVEALTRGGLSAYGTRNSVYTTHFDQAGVRRGIRGPQLREFRPQVSLGPSSGPPAASRPVSRTYAPGLTTTHRTRLAVPRPLAWLGRTAWSVVAVPFASLRWLLRLPLSMVKVPHWKIVRLLRPRGIAMPGLLTEPLLVFEITSGARTWTLEILFDFEYARFYASTASPARREVVYKIRRGFARVAKTLLEKYLERQPRGVKLLHRHPEAGERGGAPPVG